MNCSTTWCIAPRRLRFAQILSLLFLLIASQPLLAQLYPNPAPAPMVDIHGHMGVGTLRPDSSAILDAFSTASGFLLPRMNSTQRDQIAGNRPAKGLMIFNIQTDRCEINIGTKERPRWVPCQMVDTSGSLVINGPVSPNGDPGDPGDLFVSQGPNNPPIWLEPEAAVPAWFLRGNANTNPGTGTGQNFMGTRDNRDVVFATGGVERGRFLSPSNGGGFSITGPFLPGGNAGTSGMALVSSGPSTPPTWQVVPFLPAGTRNFSTLAWDSVAGMWVENINLTSNPTNGNTDINGNLNVDGNTTLNGTTVSIPNVPNVTNGTEVVITDASGNVQTININDLIGNATLTQNAIWVGDASNNPAELLSTNLQGSVLVQNASGAPTWTTPAASPFWALNGNAGTNPANNFVGTTDPSDLVFRTANTPRMRLGQGGTDNVVNITGTPDAVVGNTSADAVWDVRVAGDLYASGIFKSGGSLWMDGRNATQNQVTSDNTLWMTTRGATNALELHLDELGSAAQGRRRVMRYEPNNISANIIGGFNGNSVTAGVVGATINGGGSNGSANTVTDNFGTINGGEGNRAGDAAGTTTDARYATVSGGLSNTASGENSTVAGGYLNSASGPSNTIGGGRQNQASDVSTTIGGGMQNRATNNNAVVAGGSGNLASGNSSAVGGGASNQATSTNTTIPGGVSNTATQLNATVGGGSSNDAIAQGATVAGGEDNTAAGGASFIGGGGNNIATGTTSNIVGGVNNRVDGNQSSILGGDRDTVLGPHSMIGGGRLNKVIATADFSVIGGGQNNLINNGNSVIAGGNTNIISADGAAIGGGGENRVSGLNGTVGGGQLNNASGQTSVIAGGRLNQTTALFAHSPTTSWGMRLQLLHN